MLNGLFTYSLDTFISIQGVSSFYYYHASKKVLYFSAYSVDPDQMPHNAVYSAASDLGLHCLLVSLSGDARHKWVGLKYLHFFTENVTLHSNIIF